MRNLLEEWDEEREQLCAEVERLRGVLAIIVAAPEYAGDYAQAALTKGKLPASTDSRLPTDESSSESLRAPDNSPAT